MTNGKPLGRKAYGSIPHLPGSRLGPGDHHCHEGQAMIACVKARDKHDRIIVTEKLDGSCTVVAKVSGAILALVRAGWLAQSSKYEQHQLFAAWVRDQQSRFAGMLEEGERVCGEWLAQAHGTRYSLPHEPFVAFDIFREEKRIGHDGLRTRANAWGFICPAVLSDNGPCSIETALEYIKTSRHGAVDEVEGAVWRVERRGIFDFLCKWIRPAKKDGAYLPEISGREAVWNWRPNDRAENLKESR